MQEFGLIKSSPENIYLKASSASSSQSTECLPPELLAGDVEGQWLQWLMTNNFILFWADGKHQSLVGKTKLSPSFFYPNSKYSINFPAPYHSSVQFSSVAQLCPTLCDPMDCSMPGHAVHNQLPEFTQTHVH